MLISVILGALDWTTSTRLSTSTSFEFQSSDVSRVLVLFMLVLGRESSSWDDLGVCCDNVKPEN